MNFGVCRSALLALLACACAAERWQWPEQAASVRIDTKVRFLDQDTHSAGGRAQDEPPFQEAAQTDGFYNRAGGAGRYPVRVQAAAQPHDLYLQQLGQNYESDGTLDSLQHCKCVSSADCSPQPGSARVCGAGRSLCCYRGAHSASPQDTEFFNEIEDERPKQARPFPPAPGYNQDRGVLTGPGGPTGRVGPGQGNVGAPGVLVGPDGPTGIIGPNRQNNGAPDVLVGPEGPTGVIGPRGQSEDLVHPGKRNPDVLVGPGGPTNVIGPASAHGHRDVGQSESAQRGILVGPGGPTGIIGPRGYGQQRPVLVGPGGPTGIIGPRNQGFFNAYYGRQRNPGILVGPGGPSGIIGPGRQILVGPGGPTGRIGPQNYFV